MDTAKVFENGRSQAVRLPKSFRFKEDEVFVNRIGDVVFLIPKESPWDGTLAGLAMFSGDFMDTGRCQWEFDERPL